MKKSLEFWRQALSHNANVIAQIESQIFRLEFVIRARHKPSGEPERLTTSGEPEGTLNVSCGSPTTVTVSIHGTSAASNDAVVTYPIALTGHAGFTPPPSLKDLRRKLKEARGALKRARNRNDYIRRMIRNLSTPSQELELEF